jgi:hypothetical protein
MTFAKLYKNHAYSDLIQEAETQGIGVGVQAEQERIIKLLDTSRMCSCSPNCKTDINIFAFVLEELGINLTDLIKNGV